MSDPRDRIRQRIYADICERFNTYWTELNKNDATFSEQFKSASKRFFDFAPTDIKFLCEEVERLREELERYV